MLLPIVISRKISSQIGHRHSSLLPFFHGERCTRQNGEGKEQEKYDRLAWVENKIATRVLRDAFENLSSEQNISSYTIVTDVLI